MFGLLIYLLRVDVPSHYCLYLGVTKSFTCTNGPVLGRYFTIFVEDTAILSICIVKVHSAIGKRHLQNILAWVLNVCCHLITTNNVYIIYLTFP